AAKVVHAIFVTLLTFLSLGSISGIIHVISDFPGLIDSYQEKFLAPQPLHISIAALVPFVDLGMLLLLGGLYRRNNRSRLRMLTLLPIAGTLKSYMFYATFSGTEVFESVALEWTYLGAATVCCLGFFMIAWVIYRSPFMLRFFEGLVNQGLDAKIEEIGQSEIDHKEEK
ncbi:MAG: hypothetical protein AAFR59_09625, partial [Bacteroidota bacterium]